MKILRNLALLVTSLMLLFATDAMAKKKPILIAVPASLTGPYATDGILIKQAIEMAVEEINASGGLVGRKLKAIFGDVGGQEPEKIRSVSERLMAEKPDVVVTGYEGGAVHIFGEYDIPYLHAGGQSQFVKPVAENLEKYSNVFHFAPMEIEYGKACLNFLIRKAPGMVDWTPPNKKVAIITVDYPYSSLGAEKFAEAAKDFGYEVVVNETIPFGMAEYGPILSKIESSEPAFITYWHVTPDDPARFMKQFNDYFSDDGYKGMVWMQYAPSIPEFTELAGKDAEGVMYVSGAMGTTKKSRAYIRQWEKRYGSKPSGFYASFTRDGLDIWINAVKRAGCADCYEEVNHQIRQHSHVGMDPYLFVFDPHNQSVIYGDGLFALPMIQIQKGVHQAIWPDQFKQGNLQLQPWMKK
jgi:branched-chain amino acid transport system substrate-binding protein